MKVEMSYSERKIESAKRECEITLSENKGVNVITSSFPTNFSLCEVYPREKSSHENIGCNKELANEVWKPYIILADLVEKV